jgi:hypothetical protein
MRLVSELWVRKNLEVSGRPTTFGPKVLLPLFVLDFTVFPISSISRDNSVSLSDNGLDDRERIPGRSMDFFLRRNVQTSLVT